MTPDWTSRANNPKTEANTSSNTNTNPKGNVSSRSPAYPNPFLRRPKSESSPEQVEMTLPLTDLSGAKLSTPFQNFRLNVNSIISSNSPQHKRSNIFSRSQSQQRSSPSVGNSGDNNERSLNRGTDSGVRSQPLVLKEAVLNTPKSMVSDDRGKCFFGDMRGFERDNKADFILSKNFEGEQVERGTLVSGRSEKSYGQLRREIQNCKTKESSVEVERVEKLGISRTGGFVFRKKGSGAIEEEATEGKGSECSSERKGDFRELILSYIMEASKQRNIIKGYV